MKTRTELTLLKEIRKMKLMKALVVGAIAFLFVLASQVNAYPQTLTGVPSHVQSPKELAQWLENDFTYVFEFTDEWKSTGEMIRTKRGDCEDFALLASEILKGWGIENKVVIIQFKDLNIGHAVCAWENKNGTVSFISNTEIKHTGRKTIEAAIERYYPDWESISFADKNMNISGMVANRK